MLSLFPVACSKFGATWFKAEVNATEVKTLISAAPPAVATSNQDANPSAIPLDSPADVNTETRVRRVRGVGRRVGHLGGGEGWEWRGRHGGQRSKRREGRFCAVQEYRL